MSNGFSVNYPLLPGLLRGVGDDVEACQGDAILV